MNEQKSQTSNNICSICHKRLPDQARNGSLTSFLFQASFCSCNRNTAKPAPARNTQKESDFCQRCGLTVESNSRDGSLTGFLFFHTRCKCPPELDKTTMMSDILRSRQKKSDPLFNSRNAANVGANTIDLAEGAVIGGVYKIIKLIGRGGMGEVYLAQHQSLGNKCALKVIPPEQLTEDAWQRFQNEAKLIANLDHVNLVRVTDLGIHENCLPFCAMAYVPGKNLAELIAAEGPMPLNTALEIFLQVCDVVDYAHKHDVIHRDLKPANIMLVQSSNQTQAKVLDFGLAKLTGHNRFKQSLTQAGDIFGSPFYMSPEQCNGDKIDRRSDIYSVGCTMFECLTGEPPFKGSIAAQVMFAHTESAPPTITSTGHARDIPDSMEIVMAKLLRKNPVERYQSMGELKADLLRVQANKTVAPVYVNRSNNYEPEKKADNYKAIPSEDARIPPRNFLRLSLLAFLVLSSLSALSITIMLKDRPKVKDRPLPAPEDSFEFSLLSNSSKDTEAKSPVITEYPNYQTNIRYKKDVPPGFLTIDCPKIPLGLLYWSEKSGPAALVNRHKRFANGPIVVPQNSYLTLQIEPGTESWSKPGILSIFQNVPIQGLTINADATITDWSADRETKLSKKYVEILDAVKSWKHLDLVNFRSGYFDKNVASKLQSLTGLRSLGLVNCQIDSQTIANSNIFNKVEAIYLSAQENADEILESLNESSVVKKIDVWDTQLSERAVRKLSHCKDLRYLYISHITLNKNTIDSLAKIKSLNTLTIGKIKITPSLVRQLYVLKDIPNLGLDMSSASAADRHLLQKNLKNLMPLDYRHEQTSNFDEG